MKRALSRAAAGASALAFTTLAWTAAGLAAERGSAAQDAPVRIQLAQALLAVEQLDALYQVLEPTPVYQRPDYGSDTIDQLPGNSTVRVTGRVKGTEWLRVWSNNSAVGYVSAERLRPSGGEPGRQTAALATGPAGAVFQDCARCPEMVALPPGDFTMGSDRGDASAGPAHRVEIGYGFALGRFEVTMAEWAACAEAGACSDAPEAVEEPAQTPVRNVTWEDAQAFVAWLRKITKRPYRLPSEAEWEYAARAGTTTTFWWGDTAGAGEADCKTCGGDWNRKRPGPVGRFRPNPFGLHDMNGGVAEWMADCWFDSYEGAKADGEPRDRQNCQQRVLRGGSWKQEASYLSSHARHFYDALVPYSSNGLRVALTLEK